MQSSNVLLEKLRTYCIALSFPTQKILLPTDSKASLISVSSLSSMKQCRREPTSCLFLHHNFAGKRETGGRGQGGCPRPERENASECSTAQLDDVVGLKTKQQPQLGAPCRHWRGVGCTNFLKYYLLNFFFTSHSKCPAVVVGHPVGRGRLKHSNGGGQTICLAAFPPPPP